MRQFKSKTGRLWFYKTWGPADILLLNWRVIVFLCLPLQYSHIVHATDREVSNLLDLYITAPGVALLLPEWSRSRHLSSAGHLAI